jgi:hypothetical protein
MPSARRFNTASNPSSTSWRLVRSIVAMLASSAAAIRLSLQPSPSSDTSASARCGPSSAAGRNACRRSTCARGPGAFGGARGRTHGHPHGRRRRPRPSRGSTRRGPGARPRDRACRAPPRRDRVRCRCVDQTEGRRRGADRHHRGAPGRDQDRACRPRRYAGSSKPNAAP